MDMTGELEVDDMRGALLEAQYRLCSAYARWNAGAPVPSCFHPPVVKAMAAVAQTLAELDRLARREEHQASANDSTT